MQDFPVSAYKEIWVWRIFCVIQLINSMAIKSGKQAFGIYSSQSTAIQKETFIWRSVEEGMKEMEVPVWGLEVN